MIRPSATISRRAVLSLGLAAAATQVSRSAPAWSQPPLAPENVVENLRTSLLTIAKRGRGEVYLPAGSFVLERSGNKLAGLTVPSGTTLRGAGRDLTTLKLGDGEFGHVINAPFGNFTLSDLTIDGNRRGRPGQRGHNIRAETSNISIERVRAVNSVDYAVALGQRRYADNVKIHGLLIEDAGADGIDIKNRLSRTAVDMRDVEVRGHGRNRPVGEDGAAVHWSKAAIDLRGRCTLHGIHIAGLAKGDHGLRFRQGESGSINGRGAHGSEAHHVTIEAGSAEGVGLSVFADGVEVAELIIDGTSAAVISRGQGLTIAGGFIAGPDRNTLRAAPQGVKGSVAFKKVAFFRPVAIDRQAGAEVLFERCWFEACTGNAGDLIASLEGCEVIDCFFGASCKA